MTALAVASTQLPLQARRLIRLQGTDTLRFIQGTLSADLSAERTGQPVPATLLTIKAKIVSEAIVIVRAADAVDLWLPDALATEVAERLDRHIIMDEVEVAEHPGVGLGFAWPAGAGAAAPVAAPVAVGVEVLPCAYPVAGWLLVGQPAALETALGELAAAGQADFDAHRVEHAIPAWGHEVAPDFFPPEVGFTSAVSYDKGCFMGQEPLARIHARGQVNRVMVRVEFAGDVTCPRALSHPDRDVAGTLTTVSGGRGLAIVRRTFATPGTELGGETKVTVVSGPLGDDAGMAGAS